MKFERVILLAMHLKTFVHCIQIQWMLIYVSCSLKALKITIVTSVKTHSGRKLSYPFYSLGSTSTDFSASLAPSSAAPSGSSILAGVCSFAQWWGALSTPSFSAVFAGSSRPVTTWWPPYKSHLQGRPAICKLETTSLGGGCSDALKRPWVLK